MDTKRQAAALALLDELEVRAVYLRVSARICQRDVALLCSIEREIRLCLQALGDAKAGEQATRASREFHPLRAGGDT